MRSDDLFARGNDSFIQLARVEKSRETARETRNICGRNRHKQQSDRREEERATMDYKKTRERREPL